MFKQEKTLSDFQQMLLTSKLSICAEEAKHSSAELPYIRDCIKQFVASLTEYDHGYVSDLSKKNLEDLIALIKEPAVLSFLTSHQLDLHWIFGYRFALKGEQREISNRIKQYNAPWGKDITLTLANLLSTHPLSRFVANGMISFHDLRQWDKGSELGIDFIRSVLMYLSRHAAEVQSQLDSNKLNKASLHQYFLDQGEEGLDNMSPNHGI